MDEKEKWLTVRQFSKKHNVDEMTIRTKVKRNTIQHKKIDGVLHILDDLPEPSLVQPSENISDTQAEMDLKYTQAVKEAKELENSLKRQRLKNLQQDTLIKRQKQVFTKEKYRQQFAEGVFECFTNSFADLKSLLVQLKLNKNQMQDFQSTFKKGIKKFQQQLRKYLAAADKKELENEAQQ